MLILKEGNLSLSGDPIRKWIIDADPMAWIRKNWMIF
jgi:hypothetical protein